MITILNFCHHDRDQALRLLTWLGELGGAKGHDLVLIHNRVVLNDGSQAELVKEAEKHFDSVSTFAPFTEDERGWPYSPNHGWMQALQLVREKIQKPWFWMEPDCVFLKPKALDAFAAEYEVAVKAGKAFMGAEVTEPSHRMSGVGVYPAKVVAYLKRRHLSDLVRKEAFDSFFAEEIIPYAHFTPLIQNVWMATRNPDTLPTFPDAASLALIDPRAVMFHRCKDDTLIQQLINKMAGVRGFNVESIHHIPFTQTVSGHVSPEVESELIRQLEDAKRELAALRKSVKPGKPKRTAAEQAKIDARMAKVRAARKKAVLA